MSCINCNGCIIFGIKPKIYIVLADTAYSTRIISGFYRVTIFFPSHDITLDMIVKKIHKIHSSLVSFSIFNLTIV